MGADSVFSYSTLFGFLFTLARISGVFAFLPLAAFRAAPEAARIVLSLAMTVMLRGEWKAPVGAEVTMGRIVAGLASEAGLGLAIGVALAIVFEVFQMAAQAVSLQAGLGYASTVDPSTRVVHVQQGLGGGAGPVRGHDLQLRAAARSAVDRAAASRRRLARPAGE